jgi:hypothetical protein
MPQISRNVNGKNPGAPGLASETWDSLHSSHSALQVQVALVMRSTTTARISATGMATAAATTRMPAAISATGMAATISAAMISGECVFRTCIVTGGARVTLSISSFVPLEVVELLATASRDRSMVSVARIIAIVNVAIKTVRPMEPRTSPKKHTPDKPVGPIVAIRGTVIGSVVEIPVRAHRCYANIDGNLSWRRRSIAEKRTRENRESK